MPMLGPIQQIFDQAPIFVLVLFRLAGLIAVGPFLGSAVIPVKVRVLLAAVLSMAVFPLVVPAAAAPTSLAGMIVAIALEMIIGTTMGFALTLLFIGVQIGAEMVSYQMGLGMATLVDPMSQSRSNVLSQFYILLTTLIYVLMNGHLILIRALVQTFQTIPLMGLSQQQGIFSNIMQMFISLMTEAFMLGIRIAGPALVAIYLATLALGFISRTMPQLNILAAGFPIRITLALVLLIASLGAVGIIFEDSLFSVLEQIGSLFI